MKKIIITLSVFLLSISSFCQKIDWKQYALTGSLALLSGGCEGVADRLAFHNTSNNPFWGQNSWLNKYKNHDPSQGQTFRGKYLTFTTDGFHLMKFGSHLFTTGAVVLQFTKEKKKWWVYVIEGAGYWFVNRIGFTLTYNKF